MNRHAMDPFAAAFYAIAAFLIVAYAVAVTLLRTLSPIPPVLRVILLLLAALSALLGARLPRTDSRLERAMCAIRVRRVLWLWLILYLHLIFTFTLFDPALGRDFFSIFTAADSRADYLEWHVNLTPLYTVRTIYINGFRRGLISSHYLLLNLAGNLLVFAPFAFLLPYLQPRINRFWKFLALMLLFSVAIEACQFAMMCGSCDIDDVLLNVGGALPFWFLLKLPPLQRLIRFVTAT